MLAPALSQLSPRSNEPGLLCSSAVFGPHVAKNSVLRERYPSVTRASSEPQCQGKQHTAMETQGREREGARTLYPRRFAS